MAEEFSPEETEVFEQRLRVGLENGNNTSMHDKNMLDCVEDMATNAQASGTQTQYKGDVYIVYLLVLIINSMLNSFITLFIIDTYKGAQNRLRNYLRKVKPDCILSDGEIKLPSKTTPY